MALWSSRSFNRPKYWKPCWHVRLLDGPTWSGTLMKANKSPRGKKVEPFVHHGLRVKFELETTLSCVLVQLLMILVSCILTIHSMIHSSHQCFTHLPTYIVTTYIHYLLTYDTYQCFVLSNLQCSQSGDDP